MNVTDEMIEAGQSALTDQGYDSDMIGEMGLDAVFIAMLPETQIRMGSMAGTCSLTVGVRGRVFCGPSRRRG